MRTRRFVETRTRDDFARLARGLLRPLAVEMRKYPDFGTYAKDGWSRNVHRGFYWHLTKDPDFRVDARTGPMDASSIGFGSRGVGDLMVTSHFENWDDFYNAGETAPPHAQRPYAALIDLSAYSPDEYRQASRGFGNEMYVSGAGRAKVVRTMPIAEARALEREIDAAMPKSEDELRMFWDVVRGHKP